MMPFDASMVSFDHLGIVDQEGAVVGLDLNRTAMTSGGFGCSRPDGFTLPQLRLPPAPSHHVVLKQEKECRSPRTDFLPT